MFRNTLVVVLCVAGVAHADRYIGVHSTSSFDTIESTWTIGTQQLGDTPITPLFSGSFEEGGSAAASVLINQMVPVEGIPGVAKQAIMPLLFGTPQRQGFRVFIPDDVQFWMTVDGTNWELIPSNGSNLISLFGEPNEIRTEVRFYDYGTHDAAMTPGGGTVPAVGTWGLVVTVLALLGVGTLVMRRVAVTSP